jgi:hypothetical protein
MSIGRSELYGAQAGTFGLGLAANQLYSAFAPKKINPTKQAVANLEKDVVDKTKNAVKSLVPSEKTAKTAGYAAFAGLAVAAGALLVSLLKNNRKALIVKK